jgi:hypothetical protein
VKRLTDYLNKKPGPAVSLLVLLVAIIAINTWQLVMQNLGSDDSFSIAAAKNLDDGRGYTITTVSEHDLSAIYYDPLSKWPPGYSLLLVLVKRITNTEWITACYILNAIGTTLLILALRKIFVLLKIPGRITNIYLLFAGFFPYSFLSFCFSDLISVTCFMWAIALLLQMTIKNKNLVSSASIAGLLLGLCAWLKYLYLPVSTVPFIFLLFYSWKTSRFKLTKALIVGISLVLASTIAELLFQHYHTGSLFYLNPTKEGFFPRNLLHPGPLIPGTLLDLNFWNVQLSGLLHIPYPDFLFIWKCVNVILMIGLLTLIYRFYRNNGLRMENTLNIYMNLGMAISVSICALLCFLSLTQGPYSSHSTPFWTYIEEIRYYGVISIFIQQGMFLLILYQGELLGGFKKYFILFVAAVVVLIVVHGFYHLSKKALIEKEIGKKRSTEQFDLTVLKTANDLMKSGNKLVVCSYVDEDANIASLSGAAGLYGIEKINGELRAMKAITLLVILNKSMLPEFNHFFLRYKPTLLFNSKVWSGDDNMNDFYLVKLP